MRFFVFKIKMCQHVRDVVLWNHLLSEHQGFLYRKKDNAKWGKTSEMLELKKSSSVAKSLTDSRVTINVHCAFEKTQKSVG